MTMCRENNIYLNAQLHIFLCYNVIGAVFWKYVHFICSNHLGTLSENNDYRKFNKMNAFSCLFMLCFHLITFYVVRLRSMQSVILYSCKGAATLIVFIIACVHCNTTYSNHQGS